MEWYVKALKRYAEFSGRSQRAEYWFFTLFNAIIAIALVGAAMAVGADSGLGKMLMMAYNLYSLAVLIPGIAVSIRRLHDTNRSGWMILLALIPLIGAIILLVFFVQDSDPATNQYGSNPKALPMR